MIYLEKEKHQELLSVFDWMPVYSLKIIGIMKVVFQMLSMETRKISFETRKRVLYTNVTIVILYGSEFCKLTTYRKTEAKKNVIPVLLVPY